jgi:hypothetical protein
VILFFIHDSSKSFLFIESLEYATIMYKVHKKGKLEHELNAQYEYIKSVITVEYKNSIMNTIT